MKFKLLYYGELMTNPKSRSRHVSEIRMALHHQLKKLMGHAPWDNLAAHMVPNPTKAPILSKSLGGYVFNPLISDKLNMFVELDIQMLHPESIGFARADIDNRAKTLLDALRCPQNEHECGENMPKNTGAIYTLLDDDNLVSKLSINTSRLLSAQDIFTERASEDDEKIFLMINVNVRISEGTLDNLPFMV
ncbi:MAG: hypothetical protein LBG89_03410 [Rickettsiales bacterium]|jgi:hypothetical protein|nr:hypothetical protein [Rickettsiales bacterium]